MESTQLTPCRGSRHGCKSADSTLTVHRSTTSNRNVSLCVITLTSSFMAALWLWMLEILSEIETL
eukprot:12276222-Karenia_brevis.AAC.1